MRDAIRYEKRFRIFRFVVQRKGHNWGQGERNHCGQLVHVTLSFYQIVKSGSAILH